MRRKLSPQKNGKGFTLIEILIAILLLVIALVGLASVTVSVIKGNDLSRMVTTATTLAKDKMEELKNVSATSAGYDALTGSSDTVEAIYTRQWTVGAVGTTAPDNDTTKMKKITVTVTWTWNGQSHNVTLDTIVLRIS
jgi:type IV pilus assembly protein PilV